MAPSADTIPAPVWKPVAAEEALFAAVGQPLLILTLDGAIVAANPPAEELYGHPAQALVGLALDQLTHPDAQSRFATFAGAVQAGHSLRERSEHLRADGATLPVEVTASPFVYQNRPHILALVRDISGDVAALHDLEQRVAAHSRQMAALLETSRTVAATLDLRRLLGLILEQLSQVVEYSAAGILSLENGMFQVRAYRGPLPQEEMLKIRYPANQLFDMRTMTTRQPFIIPDLRADTPDTRAFREIVGGLFDTQYRDVRTWMRVPLLVKDKAIGQLALHHSQPDSYSARQAELALVFAHQAAVAIENARLFAAEQRRAEQFRVISELGQRITSILDIDDLLNQTVHLIQQAFNYYHVHIGLVEGEYLRFTATAGVLGDEACGCCDSVPIRIGIDGITGRAAASGQPILVNDVRQDERVIFVSEVEDGSALVVPLKVQGQVIGVLEVESQAIGAFDEIDVAVLQSLADQVAVAIENARLYEQARQLASLEERQKLARNLHDSVSQALYGIALGARTAHALLEREPALADGKGLLTEPLHYTLSLADAALAEMRALIFELRPESLQQEGLVAALTKQADSLRVRHQIEVECRLGEEPEVSLEAKEALYRIAQEALHNVAKHARARRVTLELVHGDGQVRLAVCDDGVGFDPGGPFPGHLGLESMRERAARLGGGLAVESSPGHGACVRVHLKIIGHSETGPVISQDQRALIE